MSESDLETNLKEILESLAFMDAGERDSAGVPDWVGDIARVETFEEDGVLTLNRGLVIRTKDHSEYQLTIVQSR